MDRTERYGRPLSLIVFDLDDFKFLNDLHGHQEGDLVLRRVAAAALEGLRVSDMACRIGGEEFAILLPETGKRAARAAADRLCARVRDLPGGVRRTTVSCGVASYPSDARMPRSTPRRGGARIAPRATRRLCRPAARTGRAAPSRSSL
jgi:diguanylate cyclase (GGDEF)-like protein